MPFEKKGTVKDEKEKAYKALPIHSRMVHMPTSR